MELGDTGSIGESFEIPIADQPKAAGVEKGEVQIVFEQVDPGGSTEAASSMKQKSVTQRSFDSTLGHLGPQVLRDASRISSGSGSLEGRAKAA